MLEEYLISKSASELAFKMEIAKCSTVFCPLDYVVLIIGFSQKYSNGYLFEKDVIIEMIDKYEWFDDAIKNPKCLDILLKILNKDERSPGGYHGNAKDLKQVISHILIKFPDLKKHNFMYRKYKRKIIPRFSDKEIKENY